jgi:hypothetical protein
MNRGDKMNLAEAKAVIDHIIDNLYAYQDPTKIPILITLSERSIGGRASSGVDNMVMGFDWESNQFRIQPSKSLVAKGHNFEDEKEKLFTEYNNRKYYICPRCEHIIAKGDKFCRGCGQKLKI